MKNFEQVVIDLQSFFRTREPLTENEQLFVENRLMILQWEYSFWAQRPIKIVRAPDSPLDIGATGPPPTLERP